MLAALAAAPIALTGCAAALGQELKPQAPRTHAQESVKSSPPDTNRYVRPAIPEDRLNTPLPRDGGNPPSPGRAQPQSRR
jgi:hypothetical protein